MSIKQILEKIKPFYFLFLTIVIASIFFALGRLSSLSFQNTPIKIEYSKELVNMENISQTGAVVSSEAIAETSNAEKSGEVIGSKSGKKYYFPWCGTVKRILPQNQIHFSGVEEARKAGFTPGGNCKGLK